MTRSADAARVAICLLLFSGEVEIQMIRRCRSALYIGALSGALCLPASMSAMQQTQTAPDNTKVNKREQKTAEPSADQAKNTKSDTQLTASIRRAVVKDKSLSTYAHNVKIIS